MFAFARLIRVALPIAASLVASCTAPEHVRPERFGGPISVRNQHPAQLSVLRMEPASARVLRSGQTRLDTHFSYTSLFLRGNSGTNAFVMDGEILRVGLHGHYGLADSLEIDLELPLAHTTGGFLDHFVEEWHQLLNTPNSGRSRFPQDLYAVEAVNGGATAFRMEKRSLALLDVPLVATWQLVEPTEANPVAFALRAGVELPTGDQDDGFGNGGIDYSIGAIGDVYLGPVALSAHVEHTFAANPDLAAAAGLDYGDVTSGGIGVEAFLTERIAAHVQIEADRSVLRNISGVNTDDDQWLLWIGFRAAVTDRTSVEISFGEDLIRNASPDFTAYLGFRFASSRD